MTRVAIATLGCRTNQDESSALARLLAGRGFAIVPFPGRADLGDAVAGRALA